MADYLPTATSTGVRPPIHEKNMICDARHAAEARQADIDTPEQGEQCDQICHNPKTTTRSESSAPHTLTVKSDTSTTATADVIWTINTCSALLGSF